MLMLLALLAVEPTTAIAACSAAVHGIFAEAVDACRAPASARESELCVAAFDAGLAIGRYASGMPDARRAAMITNFDVKAAECGDVTDPEALVSPPVRRLATTAVAEPARAGRARMRHTVARIRTLKRDASASRTFSSCAAARAAGAAPLYRGSPGYSGRLDRDGDGKACE